MSAAQRVVDIQLSYAKSGISLAQAALAGARTFVESNHYPAKDVFDRMTGNCFFYHTHASLRLPPKEHGHFHLFHHNQEGKTSDFFHIAGLSIDAYGTPLRWFTTNQWVTGEIIRPAQKIVQMLPDFRIRTMGRLSPISDWLSSMVALFFDDITAILLKRDAILEQRFADTPREFILEDRNFDIVSESDISLPLRLRQLTG